MHVVILGNGVSGITAARQLRKRSDYRITVISAESDYFFSRTALMYIFMGHLQFEHTKPYEDWFWEKNRIELVNGYITKVDTAKKNLEFNDGRNLNYDKLILAVGSKSNKFGWPGQDLDGVHGLYNLQDLEAMERHSEGLKQAVIVGGGLIGIEMAEMFHSRHIPVTFLVRETEYWNNVLPLEESSMISRHIREHGFDLRLSTELKEIWGDQQGKAKMVVTNKGDKIECGFVGLTAGVSPNIDFLRFGEIELDRGILVNEYLETNVPDVYAVGDCVQLRQARPGRRPIEAVWYTGRMMGETVAHTIAGTKTAYDPGIWFNSAKFLDIEYQVYGDVPNQLPNHQDTLYWEHSNGKQSIRINYDKATKTVTGFNLMGVRYRHEVCEKWLQEKTPMETVLQNLGIANFDPEFYRQYEADVVQLYNQQTGSTLSLQKKRGLAAALKFLQKQA
ncbi:MAG: FAD-dependent oxidoreductase [Phaeodactylibacter sp.]|nr:FAD-dependent oxidoreductase [Phaeodactylibacter sp.]